jgi:hypothetical protein
MPTRAEFDIATAGLSDNHLFDLARNPSAPTDTRTFAAEVLLDKGVYQAKRPEIAPLIASIEYARSEAATVAVEEAHQAQLDALAAVRVAAAADAAAKTDDAAAVQAEAVAAADAVAVQQ